MQTRTGPAVPVCPLPRESQCAFFQWYGDGTPCQPGNDGVIWSGSILAKLSDTVGDMTRKIAVLPFPL